MENKNEKALEFLKLTSNFRIKGVPIHSYFLYKSYSLWSFSHHLMWNTILSKVYASSEAWPTVMKENKIRAFLLRLLIFSISLFSLFIIKLKKPKIIIYSNDIVVGPFKNDQRIEQFYVYAKSRNIPYAEIIHTNLRWKTISNFFKRGRPVIYAEAIDYLRGWSGGYKGDDKFDLNNDLDLGNIPQELVPLARSLVTTYVGRTDASVFKIKVLNKILGFLRPKAILMIDDARYWHEIIIAGKELSIPTIAVQHSRFNKYLCGWINYGIPPEKCVVPDKYMVWNEYWRDKLIFLSSTFRYYKNNLTIGGRANPAKSVSNYVRPEISGHINILVPYESIETVRNINAYLEKFVEGDVNIIFKIRKDIPQEYQTGIISSKVIGSGKFRATDNLSESDIAAIHLITGVNSTFLYDMAEMGMPVGIMRTEMIQADDLLDGGFAKYIDMRDGDIPGQLIKIANTDKKILDEQKRILASVPFVVSLIDNILNNEKK